MTTFRAFTILEMLINLVIMSLLIGLVYFAYASFAKQVTNYKDIIEEQNTVHRLHTQLKIDFFTSEKVIKTINGFRVVNYDDTTIEYVVETKNLTRKQNQVSDSITIKDIEIQYEQKIFSNEEWIKEISIETILFNEILTFSVYKNYIPGSKVF